MTVSGRRTRLTWPDSFYVDYDHLVTGEMTKVGENGATSGAGVLATFAYDDLGRVVSLSRGNGALTTYAYDPVSRLQSLTDKPSSATWDQTITLGYNPASQIVTRTGSNDTYAWTGHGNGTTAYVSNGLNQQTSIGGSSASWDSKGNLISEPQSGKTYGYSSENLLTSASGGVTIAYDPAMRLQQITAAATTKFAYDGLDTIAEYDGAGTMLARYVFGPGIDQPLERYDGSGTSNKASLHAGERGSVISLTDSAGALLNINRYDEYGKPLSTNAGRFQYTGQMWLPEAGLYHYKARVYLPQLGVFAQTDPIGYGGSPNLYAYVLNDPINLTDPLGLQDSGGDDNNGDDKDGRVKQQCEAGDVSNCPEIVINGQQPAIIITAMNLAPVVGPAAAALAVTAGVDVRAGIQGGNASPRQPKPKQPPRPKPNVCRGVVTGVVAVAIGSAANAEILHFSDLLEAGRRGSIFGSRFGVPGSFVGAWSLVGGLYLWNRFHGDILQFTCGPK